LTHNFNKATQFADPNVGLYATEQEQQGQQPMLREIRDQRAVEVDVQVFDNLLQEPARELSHVGH